MLDGILSFIRPKKKEYMKLDKEKVSRILLGSPLDPFKSNIRQHIALVTFMAWVGLGADGISSANYGPEEAFLALGDHTDMAIFLAMLTGVTVFLIAAAYQQVIELFPRGGGGYKVATTLLGQKAGLLSGCALLIDYVLTIAISIASGMDALFSTMPANWGNYKLPFEFVIVILLTYLNLRGMKESIKILLPIFIGFIITHAVLIIYGIISHSTGITTVVPDAVNDSREFAAKIGWLPVLALFFKAFSMGGGTYTGLEAVSNSVQHLAEPRVKTGKATMWCVAASLAFMAMGIIMLYLLWDVSKVEGETLNATVFRKITAEWSIGGYNISSLFVGITMLFAAGLLFVAANTGFLAGPTVLANMAVDRWMPHTFSLLSSRLVTKNGVYLMGIAAIGALIITDGKVGVLVVLYSINVFLTFSLSLAGLTKYRWRRRRKIAQWPKLIIAFVAFLVCSSILLITLVEKFAHGAWITVVVTGALTYTGYMIKRHYTGVKRKLDSLEEELEKDEKNISIETYEIDRTAPTAVFLVSGSTASGLHCVEWVRRLFPDVFSNFVFLSVGEIDAEEFTDEELWEKLRRDTKKMLKNYVQYCHNRGLPSTFFHAYGTDVIEKLTELTDRISREYIRPVFFATRLVFEDENIFTQSLHNQTAYLLQRRLNQKGLTMIILPMKL
jgi:amino acid transporter